MAYKYNSSNYPIVNKSGANINGVYGPWDSIDAALEALAEMFSGHDLDGNVTTCDIPIGTTVGVYKDSNRKEVTEYWWINDNLAAKSFENSHFTLKITNGSGYEIESLQLREQIMPSKITILKIDISTNKVLTTGILKYSVNGGELKEFVSPLSLTDLGITSSLGVYWYVDNKLLAYKQLKVSASSYLKQSFYFSYTDEKLPSGYYYIPDPNVEGYQLSTWTPGTYAEKDADWKLYHTGILQSTPYEFVITRERIDGSWERATEPTISARWGIDGVSTYDRQAIYTLNDSYDLKAFEKESETLAGYTQQLSTLTIDEAVKYINKVTSNLYYTEANKPSPTPGKKYLWCRVREAYADNDGVLVWGAFSNPSLYSNFAEDGKDGDTVEYIYSRTADESNTLIIEEWEKIKTDTKSCTFDSIVGSKGYVYWTDDAQGVGDDNGIFYKTEWCSKRVNTNNGWGEWCSPFKWAVYGDTGNDGAGVEYVFLLSASKEPPTADCTGKDSEGRAFQDDEYLPKTGGKQWTDNYEAVSHAYPYSWYMTRRGYTNHWSEFSVPQLWMTFQQPYELFLDNDVTQIPATLNKYTAEAAKAATLTSVTLKRGNDIISPNEYDITSDYYSKDNATGKYYLSNTTISFDGNVKSFVLKAVSKSGTELASRAQSVSLLLLSSTYKMQILPNSRIWRGGLSYSASTFLITVQEITSSGLVTNVDDLSKFHLTCTPANGGDSKTIENIVSGLFTYDGGSQYDVYCYLYDEDNKTVYDVETIDTIDYSTIKGDDASFYAFNLAPDRYEVPYNKANDATFLLSNLKNYISVYKGTTPYKITNVEIDSNYGTYNNGKWKLNYSSTIPAIDSEELPVMTVSYGDQQSELSISLPTLYGDLYIPITVTIEDEGNLVRLTKVWSIILGKQEEDSYNLFVTPDTVSWYNGATSFDSESIVYTIVNSSQGTQYTSIPQSMSLVGEFVNSDGSKETMITDGALFDISGYYKKCKWGTPNKFIISLYNNNVLKAQLHVEILFKEQERSAQFLVDLSNSIVRLPNDASDESIKTATSGIVNVYYNNKQLPIYDITKEYSYQVLYGGKALGSNEYSFTKAELESNNQPVLTVKIYKYGEDYTEIEKKVIVLFVDSTTYQFSLVPSAFICAGNSNPDFGNVYVKIWKFVSGEKPELVTSQDGLELKAYSDYKATAIKLELTSDTNNRFKLTLKELLSLVNTDFSTTSIDFDLYYNSVWQDSDTVPIARNGKDVSSSSTYYINPNVLEIVFDEKSGTYNTSYLTAKCIRYLTNEVIAGVGAKGSKNYLIYHVTSPTDESQKVIAISANRTDENSNELVYAGDNCYEDFKEYVEHSEDKSQKISDALSSASLMKYDAIYIDAFDHNQDWGDTNTWFNGITANSSYTIGGLAVVLVKKVPIEYSILVTYNSYETSAIQYTYSYGMSYLNLNDVLKVEPMVSGSACNKTVEGYYYTANNTTGQPLTLTKNGNIWTIADFQNTTQDVIYLEFKIVENNEILATKVIDVKGANYSNQGVTVRTFYSVNSGSVYRDDSNISRSEKMTYKGSGWVKDESDNVLYKDYVAFIDGNGDFVPFVCKKTFLSSENISGHEYENYQSEESVIGKDTKDGDVKFSDVFEKIDNLGNGFFETISVLSGNIQQLSSSTLNVNGQLLMKNNNEIVGGINGKTDNDAVNNISKDLSFWSGGKGTGTDGSYDATFAVTKDGTLYAKKGVFQGVSGGVNISQPKAITPNDMQWIGSEEDSDGLLHLKYYIDPMKTGLNVIINTIFVEDVDGYQWGYSYHNVSSSDRDCSGWNNISSDCPENCTSYAPNSNGYWHIIPLEKLEILGDTKYSLAQLCLFKKSSDGSSIEKVFELNCIVVEFYVDMPSYNNEYLGEAGSSSENNSYNDGWIYLKGLTNSSNEKDYDKITKYTSYCDSFLQKQFRIRCVTPGRDVRVSNGEEIMYNGGFAWNSLNEKYQLLYNTCKELLSSHSTAMDMYPTAIVKFRGIPLLQLSNEIFNKSEILYTKETITNVPANITGSELFEKYLKINVTEAVKKGYEINDAFTKPNCNSITFINGVDTWEYIDTAVVVGPVCTTLEGSKNTLPSTTDTESNNTSSSTTGKRMYYGQDMYTIQGIHQNIINDLFEYSQWPGIDIIMNCTSFGEMFNNKYFFPDTPKEIKIQTRRVVLYDGGTLWIPSYIGKYNSTAFGECENPIDLTKTI